MCVSMIMLIVASLMNHVKSYISLSVVVCMYVHVEISSLTITKLMQTIIILSLYVYSYYNYLLDEFLMQIFC